MKAWEQDAWRCADCGQYTRTACLECRAPLCLDHAEASICADCSDEADRASRIDELDQ